MGSLLFSSVIRRLTHPAPPWPMSSARGSATRCERTVLASRPSVGSPFAQARGRQFEQLLGRKTGRDKPELIPGIF